MYLLFPLVGFNTGRRDVDFSCPTNYDPLPLPHGQYGYSGHVPQDVASFANSLPRLPSELDVIVVRKEGAAQSHRDFCVRRSRVLSALQWLLANNIYYHHVSINPHTLALLRRFC